MCILDSARDAAGFSRQDRLLVAFCSHQAAASRNRRKGDGTWAAAVSPHRHIVAPEPNQRSAGWLYRLRQYPGPIRKPWCSATGKAAIPIADRRSCTPARAITLGHEENNKLAQTP